MRKNLLIVSAGVFWALLAGFVWLVAGGNEGNGLAERFTNVAVILSLAIFVLGWGYSSIRILRE